MGTLKKSSWRLGHWSYSCKDESTAMTLVKRDVVVMGGGGQLLEMLMQKGGTAQEQIVTGKCRAF